MARRREFDEQAVVDTAIQVFTAHGYGGTGASELCERAGIARSSFYNAFGSVDALFERALTEYTTSGQTEREALAASAAPAPLVLWSRLAGAVGLQCATEGRPGCLSVNTAMELGRSIDTVAQILDVDRAAWIATFAAVLARGQREGSIRAELDPNTYGALVHTTQAGLRVAARVLEPSEVRAQIMAFLTAICTDSGRRDLADGTVQPDAFSTAADAR